MLLLFLYAHMVDKCLTWTIGACPVFSRTLRNSGVPDDSLVCNVLIHHGIAGRVGALGGSCQQARRPPTFPIHAFRQMHAQPPPPFPHHTLGLCHGSLHTTGDCLPGRCSTHTKHRHGPAKGVSSSHCLVERARQLVQLQQKVLESSCSQGISLNQRRAHLARGVNGCLIRNVATIDGFPTRDVSRGRRPS